MHHPTLHEENTISFKCRNTSSVTMCTTGVWIHSYFGLKDEFEYILEYEKPTTLMMMLRSNEE